MVMRCMQKITRVDKKKLSMCQSEYYNTALFWRDEGRLSFIALRVCSGKRNQTKQERHSIDRF